MNQPRRNRGLALLLVLGALVLLSLLAAAFSTLAAAERFTSRAYLDGVRARLAAESGIHAAVARLQERAERGTLWRERSWTVADGSAIRLDGAEVKDAAFMGNGDLYRVRLRDSQGCLFVNEGLEGGPDCSASRNLQRLLDVLGAQPSLNVPRLGERLLKSRPPWGYSSLFELDAVLDTEESAKVKPFLTLRAWQDPDVANPVPFSAETLGDYAVSYARPSGSAGKLYRHGPQRNADGVLIGSPLDFEPPHHAIAGRDSLVPGWIEIVARAPVNVNTASREVLTALLTDLQGVFLLERRRDGPPPPVRGALPPCESPGGAYAWTAARYRYEGDGEEAAFLFKTAAFVGPGGRRRDGIPAAAVVEEILACREGRRSPGIRGLDYAAAPFGGPFGSWVQFDRFVDALVQGGLIAEPRTSEFSGPELRIASQAAADVLKANFNPNLHLNELNPDRILFTHVDKTDLLAASTEFCFSPMGVFDLESAGHVVQGSGGTFETTARREVHATVKLFDAVRLSVQRDFQAGDFAALRGGGPETNNNRSIEAGPEPDNGEAPAENGYDGWLQLPTVGSNFAPGAVKAKGELRTTLSDGTFYPGVATSPPGGPHLGSVIHAHFQLDHAAHHHGSRGATTWPRFWDGFRTPQGSWQTVAAKRLSLARNVEDRHETLPSPYGPVEGARIGEPGRHRLARSWRGEPPGVEPAAPSDLRLDGAYVERDSAFGWWIDENVSFNVNEGVAAFWMKPAFEPGCTSKRRTLLSAGRYHAQREELQNPSPFGLFFVPPGMGSEDALPGYGAGLQGFRPASLAFGFGFSSATGYGWELGGTSPGAETAAGGHAFAFSPSLNHEGHECGRESLLKAHEWVHVAVAWNLPKNRRTTADSARVYINGRQLPGSAGIPHRFSAEGEPFRRTPGWSVHSLQAVAPGQSQASWVKNLLRLGGEPSRLFEGSGAPGPFPGNYSADATFDEFYLWMDRSARPYGGVGGLKTLWERGRYHRPDDADPLDARFTSAPLELRRGKRRVPPPVSAADPGGRVETPSETPAPPIRLLGLSWTERAESYDGVRPQLLDHASTPPKPLVPEGGSVADAGLLVGTSWTGPLRDPVFSPLHGVTAPPAGDVRLTMKLKAGTDGKASAILLASPVVDDATLHFDADGPVFLGWVMK